MLLYWSVNRLTGEGRNAIERKTATEWIHVIIVFDFYLLFLLRGRGGFTVCSDGQTVGVVFPRTGWMTQRGDASITQVRNVLSDDLL